MTDRYGPPDVLRVADVEQPVAKENEVLVTVHASTVTRGDAMLVRSAEYRFARLFTGIRRPRRTSFGTEFAGTVADVGAAVTEFQAGDEVFGAKGGANAEYLAVPESGVIAHKQRRRNFAISELSCVQIQHEIAERALKSRQAVCKENETRA